LHMNLVISLGRKRRKRLRNLRFANFLPPLL
jgi:hypothetical protein